ncbi:bifunctional 2-C-methyl-D-erythritol 4-phosphate cytidylyltransferase/2-C-methyl-D-erythritol 2,4-cyclodiphosphate synthase [Prosthecomicrobium sp. N25]|uniref:bifunctional 2-C-methyl-D-erythritol 4-phosphate cytidylyltransferase/2-C-methyl-D-erythritol 2,4-cyclodiphosphate synthase n=1 Tax=Prosthecomicrobium sp. N25 TaxID=3129254 RepID=UPI003077AE4C
MTDKAGPVPSAGDQPRVAAIIVAAGSGRRLAGAVGGRPKQYLDLWGQPLLARTLARFAAHPAIGSILTVIDPAFRDDFEACRAGLAGIADPVAGGATRQASVLAGLRALAPDEPDIVLIHDAARPFVSSSVIERTVAALREAEAVLAAVPVVDTVQKADASGLLLETIPREGLWAAQTPQGFRFARILAAHEAAAAAGRHDFTDDAAVARWAGIEVRTVLGDPGNVKITTADDLVAAERRLRMEEMLALADVRVGTGYDVHRFTEGDAVVLAGIRIPHTHKLEGHSDADVALHALTDAILGALGDGDIGSHFPPSDMRWKGADSAVFLREAARRVAARGGMIAHADISIVAEAPKIGPHREAMRARVADILGIDVDRVGVKATTNEALGFVGRREGIAAIATATIRLPFEPARR